MKILGIDPGTTPGNKCGWALINNNELVDYGYFEYSQTGVERLKNVSKDFKTLFNRIKNIDHLAIEKPYGPNRQSLETMNILFGIILAQAIAVQLFDFEFYHPSHVKKIVTGNGRASKDEVNDYICDFFNIDCIVQKDVADAIAITLTALRDIKTAKGGEKD